MPVWVLRPFALVKHPFGSCQPVYVVIDRPRCGHCVRFRKPPLSTQDIHQIAPDLWIAGPGRQSTSQHALRGVDVPLAHQETSEVIRRHTSVPTLDPTPLDTRMVRPDGLVESPSRFQRHS